MNIVKKLYNATKWSLAGLSYAYKNEFAFKLELFLAVILIPAAIMLADDLNQLLWLMFTLFLVLIVELVNSAIEAVVDRVGLEWHDLSGRAKDIGSAAVFVALVFTVLVWGLVLASRF